MDKNELNEKISKISIEEKISFLRGKNEWETYSLNPLNLRSIYFCDGPHGARKEKTSEKQGFFPASYNATCFPSLSLLAASFDKDLAYLYGETLSKEWKHFDLDVILGPGVNIKRNPLCGRNFEYFSEDPLLSGKLAAYYIKGAEDNNIGTCIKHYALNESEADRATINEIIDERTLREIYLKPFEIAIKEGNPSFIMASYNKINGEYACENVTLLKDILRDEWKYTGLVVSDWRAVNDPSLSIKNGLNIEMPYSCNVNYFKVLDDYKKGYLTKEEIDKVVYENYIGLSKFNEKRKYKANFEENYVIARKIAEESIVLLKNKDNVLPLNSSSSILIVGEFVKRVRYQGNGSSKVEPYKVSNLLNDITKYSTHYTYLRGYDSSSTKRSKKLIEEAKKVANKVDYVVAFLGLPQEIEAEGYDRRNINLPKSQIELIKELKEVNENIIVVLENGSVISLPFKDDVKGIIETYLGGEAINEAILNILFGKVNPSGRLPETFIDNVSFCPAYNYLKTNKVDSIRKEALYVGYRYYVDHKEKIAYPFGYGLSYSKLSYSLFLLEKDSINENESISLSFNITNESEIDAKEVIQVYISKPKINIFNVSKELIYFDKVLLKAKETKHIKISLNYNLLSFFNISSKKYEVENGEYIIYVSKNSIEDYYSNKIFVKGVDLSLQNIYSKEGIKKYYEGDVTSITDEEYLRLNKNANIFNISKNKIIFGENNSFAQALYLGSKGAKFFTRFIKKNDQVMEMVLETPIRQIRYFISNIFNEEDFKIMLKIMNSDHYVSNTFKLLKSILKIVKKIKY